MADTTTNATAAPAASAGTTAPASNPNSGAGASAPASSNNRSGCGDGFWTPRNIMVAVLGLPMALFALMGVINAFVNATTTASSAFGLVGGLIAIGVILIILSALGARLMSDEHSKRLMRVGIAVAGFGAIVWLLSLEIVKSLFSITVTGTGVQTPLLDQPWWALVLMAVGAVVTIWYFGREVFGEMPTKIVRDADGKERKVPLEGYDRGRAVLRLTVALAAFAGAIWFLVQIDWEQINIPEMQTDDLWKMVQDNLFKVVLMVGLLLLTAAVVAGSIQHLLSGGKGTKHIVSITTFLAWVGVLGFVLIISVGYMLSDDQKGRIKTAVSDTIVSWFQASNNNEGAEPIIEGGPKTYFKGDLGPMEIGDIKSGWIRFGDTVSATIVGGGCFRIEPEVIRWSEENRPAYSFWVDKPGESPITLRVVDFGPVTDDPKDDCKPASE